MEIPGVPIELLRVLYIASNGSPLALVGGAARDLLLHTYHRDPWRGLPDLDLVYEGNASSLVGRLDSLLSPGCTLKSQEYGRYGTVSLEISFPSGERWLLDIASSRREAYPCFAGNPSVSRGSLLEDLARRDFSVNAMAILVGPDGCLSQLLDPYNGASDLARRKLRVLHDSSFRDDPTRIVRAARYAARLGFSLELASQEQARSTVEDWPWQWQHGDLPSMAPPSLGTRLRLEIELLLTREPWDEALTLLNSWGALKLVDCALKPINAVRCALRRAQRYGIPAFPVLLACCENPVEVGERLQLPMHHQRWLSSFSALMEELPIVYSNHFKEWGPLEWTHWFESIPFILNVSQLALVACIRPRKPLIHWWFCWRHVAAGVTGAQLVADGMEPGPAVGERLRCLRDQRLSSLPWSP